MIVDILDNIYATGLDKYSVGDKVAIQNRDKIEIYKVEADIPSTYAVKVAIDEGMLRFLQEVDPLKYNIVADRNPTINDIYEIPGVTWYNFVTNETFKLSIKSTDTEAVWVGDRGSIISPIPLSQKVDIFDNGKCIALYSLDKNGNDLGGKYNGYVLGNVYFGNGVINGCATVYNNFGKIELNNLPFENEDVITVSFYTKWRGRDYNMPFGFETYDLYCYGDAFGFNTACGDIYGFRGFRQYRDQWIHIIAEFHHGNVALNKIWINGEEKILKQIYGRSSSYTAKISTKASIFGWRRNNGYVYWGDIDQLRLFKGSLTQDEVNILVNEKDMK